MDAKKRLQDIIGQFSEHGLTELEFEIPDFKIRLVKENPIMQPFLPVQNNVVSQIPQQPMGTETVNMQAVQVAEMPKEQEGTSLYDEVKSTLVGTFYAYPSPTDEPFVSVGAKVKKGETMCIIEAMKIMNELCAPYDLTVKSIKCENGAMVQYDQVLFEVEKC